MFRPRIIPVLLLKGKGLVKSIRFNAPRYIGDPINAVKIFNDLKADELVFLDIMASKENRSISLDFVSKVGEEANMPFAVGGGISDLNQIQAIIGAGAEKVIINTQAVINPTFICDASNTFGSSTIVVCMDVKTNIFGKYELIYKNASKKSKINIIEYAQKMQEYGAGEIIIQSVDRDGTYQGYDLELIKMISKAVTIPVVALGGAKDYKNLRDPFLNANASAVAGGSLFVYHGPRKAVLINYPNSKEVFNSENIY